MGDYDTTMELAGEAMAELLGVEEVTYTPRSGTARTIDVVIERTGVEDNLPTARIKARSHATSGLTAGTIDTGGDTITWAPKRGGTTRTSRIVALVGATAGTVTVEVQ